MKHLSHTINKNEMVSVESVSSQTGCIDLETEDLSKLPAQFITNINQATKTGN